VAKRDELALGQQESWLLVGSFVSVCHSSVHFLHPDLAASTREDLDSIDFPLALGAGTIAVLQLSFRTSLPCCCF